MNKTYRYGSGKISESNTPNAGYLMQSALEYKTVKDAIAAAKVEALKIWRDGQDYEDVPLSDLKIGILSGTDIINEKPLKDWID